MEKEIPQPLWQTVPNLEKNFGLLEIKVTNFLFDFDKKKKFAYYIISCRYTRHIKWEVKRRFKQFERLAEDLKRSFISIPALPGKTFFTITKDAKLEKRREALDSFVQDVVRREEMFSHPHFYNFFMVAQNVPFLCTNFPVPIGKIGNNAGMGYRDAWCSLEDELAVVASHSIFVANRFESYFSNLFSKKKIVQPKVVVSKASEKSVGMVEVLRRGGLKTVQSLLQQSRKRENEEVMELRGDEEDDIEGTLQEENNAEKEALAYFTYYKAFDKAFTSQVIALEWSRELQKVAVGLDSGDVFVYGLEKESPEAFTTELNFLRAHQKRVMRFAFDDKKHLLYSVGEDRRLLTYDLYEGKILDRMQLPAAKPTHFLYHKKSSVGLVADKDGSVHVVNLAKPHPEMQQKIDTKMKGPIRGLFEVFGKGVFIAVSHSDGMIKAFKNQNMADPNNRFACVLHLQGPPGARCAYYWEARRELWVGYAKGIVSVFANVSFEPKDLAEDPPVRSDPACRPSLTSLRAAAPRRPHRNKSLPRARGPADGQQRHDHPGSPA